jgi:hypothetical protein
LHLDEHFLWSECGWGGGSEAASRPLRQHRGQCSRRPLAPFVVTHAANRPAAAPSFWGEKLSAILRARATGGGEWDRPAGTSEHTDQASDLLRKESECCCRNRSDLLWRESERCQKKKTETGNNNVRLWCEKKGNLGWQSKETSPKTWVYLIGSQAKETHPNKHASPVRNYR